jgi:hypothetical protein
LEVIVWVNSTITRSAVSDFEIEDVLLTAVD